MRVHAAAGSADLLRRVKVADDRAAGVRGPDSRIRTTRTAGTRNPKDRAARTATIRIIDGS